MKGFFASASSLGAADVASKYPYPRDVFHGVWFAAVILVFMPLTHVGARVIPQNDEKDARMLESVGTTVPNGALGDGQGCKGPQPLHGPVLIACATMLIALLVIVLLASDRFVSAFERLIYAWRQSGAAQQGLTQRRPLLRRGSSARRDGCTCGLRGGQRTVASVLAPVSRKTSSIAFSPLQPSSAPIVDTLHNDTRCGNIKEAQAQLISPSRSPIVSFSATVDDTDRDESDGDISLPLQGLTDRAKSLASLTSAYADSYEERPSFDISSDTTPALGFDEEVYSQVLGGETTVGRLVRQLSRRFANFAPSANALATEDRKYSLAPIREEDDEGRSSSTLFLSAQDASLSRVATSEHTDGSASPTLVVQVQDNTLGASTKTADSAGFESPRSCLGGKVVEVGRTVYRAPSFSDSAVVELVKPAEAKVQQSPAWSPVTRERPLQRPRGGRPPPLPMQRRCVSSSS